MYNRWPGLITKRVISSRRQPLDKGHEQNEAERRCQVIYKYLKEYKEYKIIHTHTHIYIYTYMICCLKKYVTPSTRLSNKNSYIRRTL